MADMPDPIPESSGRNPRGYGVGVSNAAAMEGNDRRESSELMKAVVERGNMKAAYAKPQWGFRLRRRYSDFSGNSVSFFPGLCDQSDR